MDIRSRGLAVSETTPITVVMPVKNIVCFVSESIESILAQTFTDFRFIIVDDASTDGTFEVVQEYAKKDSRIDLFRSPEPGIVNCLNYGVALNESPFIARMDGDDIADPTRFQKQYDFMCEHPDVHVCGSWIRLFGDKEEVWHYREWDEHIKNLMVFKRSGFGHNAVMFRKEIFDDYRYEREFEFVEDYRLWSKLAADGRYGFHNLREVLVDYRIHATQVISTKQDIQNVLRRIILKDFWQDLGIMLTDEEFELLWRIREFDISSEELPVAIHFLNKLKAQTSLHFEDKFGVYDEYMDKLRSSVVSHAS